MKRKSIRTILQEQELEAITIVEPEGEPESNTVLEQNNVITQNNVKRV